MLISKKIEELLNDTILDFYRLSGGLTNDVWYVKTLNYGKLVVRIPGEGTNQYINRESEISNINAIKDLDIMPKIIYSSIENGIVIMEYIDNGIEFNINLFNNFEARQRVIKLLINLHSSKIKFNYEFDILEEIHKYKDIVSKKGIKLPDMMNDISIIIENIIEKNNDLFTKNLVNCHIDPRFNNFIFSGKKIYLIDWEYSGRADLYFELVNFVLTNDLNEEDENIFITDYFNLSKSVFDNKKYTYYKIITDYLWSYWHIIKLNQKEDEYYNEKKWKERLHRALINVKKLEGGI